MKQNKKLIALLASLVLVACGGNSSETSKSDQSSLPPASSTPSSSEVEPSSSIEESSQTPSSDTSVKETYDEYFAGETVIMGWPAAIIEDYMKDPTVNRSKVSISAMEGIEGEKTITAFDEEALYVNINFVDDPSGTTAMAAANDYLTTLDNSGWLFAGQDDFGSVYFVDSETQTVLIDLSVYEEGEFTDGTVYPACIDMYITPILSSVSFEEQFDIIVDGNAESLFEELRASVNPDAPSLPVLGGDAAYFTALDFKTDLGDSVWYSFVMGFGTEDEAAKSALIDYKADLLAAGFVETEEGFGDYNYENDFYIVELNEAVDYVLIGDEGQYAPALLRFDVTIKKPAEVEKVGADVGESLDVFQKAIGWPTDLIATFALEYGGEGLFFPAISNINVLYHFQTSYEDYYTKEVYQQFEIIVIGDDVLNYGESLVAAGFTDEGGHFGSYTYSTVINDKSIVVNVMYNDNSDSFFDDSFTTESHTMITLAIYSLVI